MFKKNRGPFQRGNNKAPKNFSIHAPWTGAALALIAITQLPIALKATLDIVCFSESINQSSPINWCKKV